LKLGAHVAPVLDPYWRPAPTGFGASGTTSPGVPTPRWTTGRARASWPTPPSGKERRS
jgi:hypothetical protein